MKYNLDKKEIICEKELNNLDKFVLDFIRILKKHADYVIVSGYVSIILGRTRTTEDVDVFIRKISFERFSALYTDLIKNGFWCINAEKDRDIFSYLKDGLAIRFSREGSSIPNFEVKFPKDELDEEVFDDFITLKTGEGEIKISSLERNIAFKKFGLGSDKDIEDAIHLEDLFKDKIDKGKINKIKELIKLREKWKTRNPKN